MIIKASSKVWRVVSEMTKIIKIWECGELSCGVTIFNKRHWVSYVGSCIGVRVLWTDGSRQYIEKRQRWAAAMTTVEDRRVWWQLD